jgi:replicative DNA helicase
MSDNGSPWKQRTTSGATPADWKAWREEALRRLNLHDIYGDILTGQTQGPGWLEARDPASPTGDRTPSAGVADSTPDAERGSFKSFRDGRCLSVFDYLVDRNKAADFYDAERIIAGMTGVPLPKGDYSGNGKAREESRVGGVDDDYHFEAIDSHTFFTTSYKLEWLVKRLLVRGQPGVLGGPKKTLKTSTLTDLAISLATQTPFLGHFDVYKPHRVLLISGESGETVLQECGRRVCAARGINPERALGNLFWSFRLPQVANPLHRSRMREGIKGLGFTVGLLDPLYLCLLTGGDAREVEAGNLYHMGPLLRDLARICLDVGCTPILCHHTRKNLANGSDPLDLDDLAFSGIGEFARQWMLENRREPFDPQTGTSKLWLTVGGSAGQSGVWAVDVEEGVLADDFTGRKWEVEVKGVGDARQEMADQGESRKQEHQARQDKADDAAILNAIDLLMRPVPASPTPPTRSGRKRKKKAVEQDARQPDPPSKTAVQEQSRLSPARANRAVVRLLHAGVIEEVDVVIRVGKGKMTRRTVKGIRRGHEWSQTTMPTTPINRGGRVQSG